MHIFGAQDRGRKRRANLYVPAALLVASLAMPLGEANAFDLFGVHLFGPKEDAYIVNPLTYTVTFDTDGADSALKSALRDASVLLADKAKPVSGSLGLIAKARTERENLVAALYAEARYNGLVDIAIAGRPLDQIAPDADFGPGPVPVTVSVEPGPVFTLGKISVTGDTAGIMPARYGLVPGAKANSTLVLQAQHDMVAALKEQGRPLARVASRNVVADHDTLTLDVALVLEAGPVASYGQTAVEGAKDVDSGFIAYMAGLKPGEPYDPKDLKNARDRLIGLDVFNSVVVQEADGLNADGSLPVGVTVSERKHRYFGVGATYSSTEGGGIEGYWGHRNLFGHAEKLRIHGSISRIGETGDLGQLNYNAGIMFEKPGVLGPPSKFMSSLEWASEHTDAYDSFSVDGRAGVTREIDPRQTVSGEVRATWSHVTNDPLGTPTMDRHLLVSIPLEYVYDSRNDKLNPTNGWRALAHAEPTHDLLTGASFLKMNGEASAYLAFDKQGKFVLAGRVAAGSIVGASLASIPADRRFYAGGGGSVRGYAYQGVGPEDASGQPTGGRSFAESSVEMRIAVNDKFGIVPFIDAGTVSQELVPDFSDVRVGAGLGLRYLTGFGPLRVDVGFPLNPRPGDPKFGLYAGIGQAF